MATQKHEVDRVDRSARVELDALFDELLGASSEDVRDSSLLQEFRRVEGKPGLYLREPTMAEQVRLVELFDALPEDSGYAGQLRMSAGIAALVLYKLQLPKDRKAALAALAAYALEEVDAPQVLVRLTEDEVLRRFKNLAELNELVLLPSEVLKLSTAEGSPEDAVPNDSTPQRTTDS